MKEETTTSQGEQQQPKTRHVVAYATGGVVTHCPYFDARIVAAGCINCPYFDGAGVNSSSGLNHVLCTYQLSGARKLLRARPMKVATSRKGTRTIWTDKYREYLRQHYPDATTTPAEMVDQLKAMGMQSATIDKVRAAANKLGLHRPIAEIIEYNRQLVAEGKEPKTKTSQFFKFAPISKDSRKKLQAFYNLRHRMRSKGYIIDNTQKDIYYNHATKRRKLMEKHAQAMGMQIIELKRY